MTEPAAPVVGLLLAALGPRLERFVVCKRGLLVANELTAAGALGDGASGGGHCRHLRSSAERNKHSKWHAQFPPDRVINLKMRTMNWPNEMRKRIAAKLEQASNQKFVNMMQAILDEAQG